jgi:VCBS repeat-containing protein
VVGNITVDTVSPDSDPASATVAEDATTPILVTLSGTDFGSGVASYTISDVSSLHGTLYTDATGTTPAVVGTPFASNELYFRPAANFNGNATFTYTVTDTAGNVDATPATATINVSAVNDAPTATSTSVSLTAVNEDTANPAGATVSSLFGSAFSDAADNQTPGGSSANTFYGIAIVDNDATAAQGEWQWYDVAGGGTWTQISETTYTTSVALFLGADTLVRFVPAANYNGTPGALTVRLIESGTAHLSGETVNVSGSFSGGSSPNSDLANTVTLTTSVTSVNDAAVIGGTTTGSVTEEDVDGSGNLTASGTLSISDVDSPTTFAAQAGTAGDNSYGTFTLATNGAWTYTASNSNAAIQALGAGEILTDSFTAVSADGTTQVVTVTINGANDVPTITGDTTGDVTEDGTLTATGALAVTDTDTGESEATVVAAGAASASGYGTYEVAADGSWIYTLDNANTDVQALGEGETLTDTFTVTSTDGTESQVVTVTINGANDVPTITGDTTGGVTEDGTLTATGALAVTDTDTGESEATVVAAGAASASGYGTYAVASDGSWTYTLNNANIDVQALDEGETLTDTFTVTSADGTGSQVVTVTINGANGDMEGDAGDDNFTYNLGAVAGLVTVNGGEPVTGTDADTLTVNFDNNANGTVGSPVTAQVQSGRVEIDVDGDGNTDLSVKDVEEIVLNTLDGDDVLALSGDFSTAGVAASTIVANLGAGNDTFSVTAPAGVSFEINGEDGADTITGGELADVINGGAGNDTINYTLGNGADTVDGGADNDTLNIAGTSGVDAVTINGSTLGGLASVANVETINVNLGAGNDTLTVTALTPGATTIALNGEGGADTLDVSALSTAGAGVTVTLGSAASNVTGSNVGAGVTLSQANFENVTGGAGADTLTGDTLANTLNGGVGNDALNGGAGHDTLNGGSGIDILTGSTGNDSLNGGNGADTLNGGAGNDSLLGGSGNDILTGAGGQDTFTGGLGADRFDFNLLAESTVGTAHDQILDFTSGDLIDLAGIDARTNLAGNNVFSYIGERSFSGVAGQLHSQIVSGNTIVSGDVNGDAVADFEIEVTGVHHFSSADFVR